MNKKNLFIIVLLIITAIYYFPIINLPPGPFDEGVILVGAERILKGQIPSRDFFTQYTPGQVYTLAALFKIFGISFITERAYDIVIKSLISLFVFLIIRLFSSNKIALVGWAMSLMWVTLSSFAAYPVHPSILCIYISVYFLLLHMKSEIRSEQDKIHYVILSALFIVLAILFRHDLGGPAAVVIALVLMLRRITGVEISWIPLISYIATGIIAGLSVLIYFYLNSAIKIMVDDLILYPINVFIKYQDFPYPLLSKNTLPFYVFPWITIFGVLTFLIFIKRKIDNTTAYGILLISCIGIVFFNQVRMRSDLIHLLPVALTGILLAPILLSTLPKGLSLSIWQNRIVWALFIIVFGITLYKPLSMKVPYLRISYVVKAVNPDIKRAKYLEIDPDLKKTVTYVKDNTSKNEYIYVGAKNHDKVIFNHPIVYFLAERNPATKYHELNPNLTKTIQEEIVNELKEKSVRLVVLTPGWRYEPNLSSIDLKIDLLDDYISTNFELKETYGIFEIWTKKS